MSTKIYTTVHSQGKKKQDEDENQHRSLNCYKEAF